MGEVAKRKGDEKEEVVNRRREGYGSGGKGDEGVRMVAKSKKAWE